MMRRFNRYPVYGSPPGQNARSDRFRQENRLRFLLSRPLLSVFVAALGLAGGLVPAQSMPSFARQTGQTCSACHTSIPQLTAYGRQFKLSGYLEKTDGAPALPIAGLLIGGYTKTKTASSTTLDQVGVFYAGKIAGKVGAFVQVTYDPAAKAWGWDNTDIRFATSGKLLGHEATLGLSLNNNPTVQDVWATTPAWGYPPFDSTFAPAVGLGATQLEGGLGGLVMGLTGYAQLDNGLYLEFGGYKGLSQSTLTHLGAAGAGFDVAGLAPYARIAYSQDAGPGTLMVGAIGMISNLQPGYTAVNGNDRYADFGVDAQYEYPGSNYGLTLKARLISEAQKLVASKATGGATNLNNNLSTVNLSATYHKPKWAATLAYASVTGSSDALLYPGGAGGSATNSPNGSSVSLEVNYSPFMEGGPPGFKSSNMKFGLKYSHFLKLNGAATNYDGAGANASDSDYLFAYAVVAF